jgi:nicotinate dehydrogenase subunit B
MAKTTALNVNGKSVKVTADAPGMPPLYVLCDNRPAERPWGAGEPAAAVVPSAISNAVFDAICVRLRSVPFTPDKVKAAMAGSPRTG